MGPMIPTGQAVIHVRAFPGAGDDLSYWEMAAILTTIFQFLCIKQNKLSEMTFDAYWQDVMMFSGCIDKLDPPGGWGRAIA